MLEVTCLPTRGDECPVCDALTTSEGPGRFFANRPVVYWLSLAGSGGASAYALMRVIRPRGDARLPWAAMAVLETGITIGMIRARNSAMAGDGSTPSLA